MLKFEKADKQKVTEDVSAQCYIAVDPHFRQWLQAIDPEQGDPDEAALRWQAPTSFLRRAAS